MWGSNSRPLALKLQVISLVRLWRGDRQLGESLETYVRQGLKRTEILDFM